MSATAVQPFRDAFDRLGDAGRTVDLWWRDDDAIRDTNALDRLLKLADAARAPVALAVIPARVEPSLVDRVSDRRDVAVLVHGLKHANHARAGEKPAEFGPHRPGSDLARDAAEGLRRTKAAFGSAIVPVFVPPWNRVAPELVPALPGLGYRGVSAFGRPGSAVATPSLVRLDTHIDPVAWRTTRSLAEPARLAAAWRDATVSPGPVGLLTHHLVFDEALWRFCEELLELAASHAAIRWKSIGELIGVEPAAPFPHSLHAIPRPESPAAEAACP